MKEQLLSGKIALVTGSGRGIGRAIAEHLASLGCSIAIHGRRENGPSEYGEGGTLQDVASELKETYGVNVESFRADLIDPLETTRLIANIEEKLGPLDFAILNAGGDIGAQGGKPSPNDCVGIPPEDVQAVMNNNFLSTVYTCQAVARGMIERRAGGIITISSTAAFVSQEHAAIYSASKAAVVHYTRSLASQLRPYNITVNSIAPGDTRTARYLATRDVPSERLENGTLDRVAQVGEVSRVVEFFVSSLGDFVSGQVLRVDGAGQCWPA
ncbi:SDR family NAD(P)-dependent oxidoreductase [Candidatus Pantoea communis]|nr:SDR family oxidoreductase [Pantoea communis]